jgi:membrane protease YdiL (CAAX protease family)
VAFFAAIFGMLGANAMLAGVVLAFYWRKSPDSGVAIEAVQAWALSLGGLAASATVTGAVLCLVSIAGARLGTPLVRQRLRFVPSPFRALHVAAAAGVTFLCGFVFSQGVDLLGIKDDGVLALIGKSVNEASWTAWTISLVGLAVVPGIAEELFFRGFVQTRAVAVLGEAKGIILAATLFGLFHMDVKQGLFAALVGTFLGWVAVRAGSIRPSMVAHGVSNFLSLCMGRFGVGPETNTAKLISVALATLAIVGAVIALARLQPPPQPSDERTAD